MENIKCVVVGDGAVGKTCMCICFTQNSFPTDYIPTVFDNYSANVMIDKKLVNLGVWDTAGQDDYDRIRPISHKNADVFLICYAVDNPTSFSNIKARWVPELENFSKDVPRMLCATKIDLRFDTEAQAQLIASGEQFIDTDQGKTLATEIHASFIECSALTQSNLPQVFESCIRLVFKHREELAQAEEAKKKKCCSVM